MIRDRSVFFVMPAQAGIQCYWQNMDLDSSYWIKSSTGSAGMTNVGAENSPTVSYGSGDGVRIEQRTTE